MKINFSKKIELVTNLAIVVVACLLATVLVKDRLINRSPVPVAPRETQSATPPNLSALDVSWTRSSRTLVLAISAMCHFCTESAPFYKTLALNKGDARLVAVLPQSVEEGTKYLAKLGVVVDEVKQLPLNEIGIYGTPSVVLVDASGTVKNFWQGKLPSDQEQAVLDALRKEKG